MRTHLLILATCLIAAAARAEPLPPGCGAAVAEAEQRYALPQHLLGAIALVESGRPDPVSGRLTPWPWTIDVNGAGMVFASKADAIAAVRAEQQRGVRSVDVGCLQVNLMHHPDAFATLEQAFDPRANARWAARFLVSLHAALGSWSKAAAAYHSQTPVVAAPYKARVMALWSGGDDDDDAGYTQYKPGFAASLRAMHAADARLRAGAAVITARLN